MFASRIARPAVNTMKVATRGISSGGAVWGKSNSAYVGFVVLGAVILEASYGTASNFIWESANQGKLYHQINWTRFKTDDDEDEDE